jgi:hypothetical protein
LQKIPTLPGFEPQTVQLIVNSYNDNAIPVHTILLCDDEYGSAVFASVTSKCTRRFIMFSVITNIYNKKIKGPTLMELFTATERLKMIF